MKKLYIGLDIYEIHLKRAAMRKNGTVEFQGICGILCDHDTSIKDTPDNRSTVVESSNYN